MKSNEYMIIIGYDVLSELKKMENVYVISGRDRDEAIINLQRKYPDVDTRKVIHVIKMTCIPDINSVIKKKNDKDLKLAEKARKRIEKSLAKKEKIREKSKRRADKLRAKSTKKWNDEQEAKKKENK